MPNSPARLANFSRPIPRRDFVKAGVLAMGGLTMGDVLRLRAESPAGKPRQKSAIMIFLSGGPSHLDMYDMKPDAPSEYRGEFSPIRTNVPGIEISELMPQQAKIADKFTILRGCQLANLHTGNAFYSGYGWQENPRASVPGEARRPALGAVVSRIRKTDPAVPPYVSLENPADWERAYYLGLEHEPFRVGSGQAKEVLENMSRPQGVTAERLGSRSDLLHSFDQFRRDLDIHGRPKAIDVFQSRSIEIVATDKVRAAFDVDREPKEVRARYGEGLSTHGTWSLMLKARRLVEAGVSVVTLCVHGWDTHRENFKSLRQLVPPVDTALAALIHDLEDRGMLDDVAVLLGGEFGRTPRIGDMTPDGRGHWPEAGFLWMAGGGIKGGQIIGATDGHGEQIIGKPIQIQNVLTSLYGIMGIDPATTFPDHNGRPQFVLEDRTPVSGLV